MTIWDTIYKKYQNGGEARATLSEEINPLFQNFVENATFVQKRALDIGCGTGKYIQFLNEYGFCTDGIDSSETAVEITKKIAPMSSTIQCTDMFSFTLPQQTYDFIFSISTIHHGTKEQVQQLIHDIHEALVEGGKIFITVPNFESGSKQDILKDHEEIADGTFAPLSGPEK